MAEALVAPNVVDNYPYPFPSLTPLGRSGKIELTIKDDPFIGTESAPRVPSPAPLEAATEESGPSGAGAVGVTP